MRYAIYTLRKHPSRAHLHVVADAGTPEQMIFDGQPKAAAWMPLSVRFVGNDLRPADVSTIFGPGALVVSADARRKLASVFDGENYEFLPLDCDGQTFFVINLLGSVDCLRADKSNLNVEPKKYNFNPSRFTRPLFRIPDGPSGAVLVLEDSRDVKRGFKYQVESQRLSGLRFDLVWEGNDKRQLETHPPTHRESKPDLPVPEQVEASQSGSKVILRWAKTTDIDTYLVQWSRSADSGFVTLGTVENTGSHPTYIDIQPAEGTSYYRVFSYAGNTRYRSKPSAAIEVKR